MQIFFRANFLRFSSLIILFSLTASQVNAQISASVTTGCAPLNNVSFTGLAGATGILWDFKDGGFANINDPSHSFAAQGTYVVDYTATVSGNPVNETITIQVFGDPVPNYTIPASDTMGCMPLNICFDATASAGGGGSQIMTYTWDFADGSASYDAETTCHTYTTKGEYTPILTVVDANGCKAVFGIDKTVKTSDHPNAVITTTPSPATKCTPPLNVSFSGSSSEAIMPSGVSGTLTYTWTFEDTTHSSQMIPPDIRVYDTLGTFPIKLTVNDIYGCSSTTTMNVVVNNPVANFATFSGVDSICFKTSFINKSSSNSVLWDFGHNNSFSTQINPVHTFPDTGFYRVKIKVTQGTCTDTLSRLILVTNPYPSFSWTPQILCSLPAEVFYKDTSHLMRGFTVTNQWIAYDYSPAYSFLATGITDTTGFKDDSTTVKIVADSLNLTIVNIDHNPFTIPEPGKTPTKVALVQTNEFGCRDTMFHWNTDTIAIPTARFVTDVIKGCAPLTVEFFDSSKTYFSHVAIPWKITSWKYEWGDGTSDYTSTDSGHYFHEFTNPGIYYVSLEIQIDQGCSDTSILVPIYVGEAPTVDFTLNKTSICPGENVSIISNFTDSVDVFHYYGDTFNALSHCPGDATVQWNFPNSFGPQDITLEACYRGCCTKLTKDDVVDVKGPKLDARVAMDCSTPLNYEFTALTAGADEVTINYGDGNSETLTTTGNSTDFAHTYEDKSLDYTVTITAKSNTSGCADVVETFPVRVRNINVEFIKDTVACFNEDFGLALDMTKTRDVTVADNGFYTWIFGDGTGPRINTDTTAIHKYTKGTYHVMVIGTDDNGCRDTAKLIVKSYELTASFTAPASFCIPSHVIFDNTTISDTTIVKTTWEFADPDSLLPAVIISNVAEDYVHQYISYPTVGYFNVILSMEDAAGCTHSFSDQLIPAPINSDISYVTPLCDEGISYFAPVDSLNTSYVSYSWDFGTSAGIDDKSTEKRPTFTYTTEGTYTVGLTITNTDGCSRTQEETVEVHSTPDAQFKIDGVDDGVQACYPYTSFFTDISNNPDFGSREWNLGSGNELNNGVTVSKTYSSPADYPIKLIITSVYGCKDSITRTLSVKGPLADLTVDKTSICKGEQVSFNIKDSTDVFYYFWDFGDGYDTSNISPILHNYDFRPPTGVVKPKLNYYSDGMSCPKSKEVSINIIQVFSGFNRNNEAATIVPSDTSHCLGVEDKFTNTSTLADTWTWDFGDGTTSTDNNPLHNYAASGIYNVKLSISSNQYACTDIMSKKMIVFNQPVITVNDVDTCAGKSIALRASGGVTYTWSPKEYISALDVASPVVTPPSTKTYYVESLDVNGCAGKDSVVVTIIQAPVKYDWDTTIIIGQSTELMANSGSVYIYSWSPIDSLSCTNCPNPIASPTEDKTYIATVKDTMGCFEILSNYFVEVLPKSSVDVPSAFTPNGDGNNDKVYVDGWGIKRLVEFRIYNRYGELLFITDNIKEGWDGTYKGVPQNMETYVYQATVETYIDPEPLTKKGYIQLLR